MSDIVHGSHCPVEETCTFPEMRARDLDGLCFDCFVSNGKQGKQNQVEDEGSMAPKQKAAESTERDTRKIRDAASYPPWNVELEQISAMMALAEIQGTDSA